MTPKEYRLSLFEKNFSAFREKRIVLYGTGANTEAVLERFRNRYRFIGLMDRAKTGQTLYGLPVLSEKEALERGTELVIMAAKADAIEPVFRKISPFCREHGIPLYDLYGLEEEVLHGELQSQRALRLSEWKELCLGYRSVSFSLMDTLLGRDLFYTMSLSVRPMFLSLYRWLREQRIPVFFIASPNFSEALQREALRERGIETEEIETEENGTGGTILVQTWKEDFYPELRRRAPEGPMLHVGSDFFWDGIAPRLFGIDTYRMVYANVRPILHKAEGTGDLLLYRPEQQGNALLRQRISEWIRDSDIISFDLFDTLLLRPLPDPPDLFCLLELTAEETGLRYSARDRMEEQLFHPAETLRQLYGRLRERWGLSGEESERLLSEEVLLEQKLCRPREAVLTLLQEAIDQGKRVFLTSDMYLERDQLMPILEQAGIRGYEALLISCEEGKKKTEGLFDRLKDLAGEGKRILHIGDSLECDMLPGTLSKIRCVQIPSVRELAGNSGFEAVLERAENLSERMLIGLCMARVFADPFQENLKERESREKETLRRYAVLAVFPAAAGYLSWLVQKLGNTQRMPGTPERGLKPVRPEKMLFASRDGYLLQEAYERIRRRIASNVRLPESLYFYTSRRAAFLPNAGGDGFAGYFSYRGEKKTPESLLQDVYGLPIEEIRPFEGDRHSPEDRKEYILLHSRAILETAEKARLHSFRYFRREGLLMGETYGFSDLIAAGFTQYFLSHFAPFRLKGYYLSRREMEQELDLEAESYLPEGESLIRDHFPELEHFFAEPGPSVASYGKDGTPEFFPEERSEEALQAIRAVQFEARTLLAFYFERLYQPGELIRPEIAEQLFKMNPDPGIRVKSFDSWLQEEQ